MKYSDDVDDLECNNDDDDDDINQQIYIYVYQPPQSLV